MKSKRVLVIVAIISLIVFGFYSCTLLGVGKLERVDLFIAALNSSTGDEASVNEILTHLAVGQIYDQIKTPDWWSTSVFSHTNKLFTLQNLTESGDTVTATITSEGGLNDSITFTMVTSGLFDWFIKTINIDGTDIIY